jgi:hypothetical protein
MGFRQKRAFKKKVAKKRATKDSINAMGVVEGNLGAFTPQVIRGAEGKKKLRRWSFYGLLSKERFIGPDGRVVEKPEEAALDTDGAPLKKMVVHRMGLSHIMICAETEAKQAASDIEKELKDRPEYKGEPLKVFPTPHETVSDVVRNQMSGVKAQNDILQIALEAMAEDYIAGRGVSSMDIGELKGNYYRNAFKKLYNIKDTKEDSGLVDASGNAIPTSEPTPEPLVT